jgi:glycosyltransferase involved in cell wall biosynthesis
MKLISHVNGDSDLIEAWIKYYLRLGVDSFHVVLHGDPEDNKRLLSLKDQYPIQIEDAYQGPFACEEKKARLDAILARCLNEWVVLVDSDEFVEFPYDGIARTVEMLGAANANVMAAPMLQRLTSDGSLDSPEIIEDPFRAFPLCSVTLYRKMGMKGDTFKFPLFYSTGGTRLFEEGNHHPPIGAEPRTSGIRGVTHHFKFRRTVARRLDNMIRSEHPWRHESVQFREYLDAHANRLPLDGAFSYSRDDLFRRRLLRPLPNLPRLKLVEEADTAHESSSRARVQPLTAPEATKTSGASPESSGKKASGKKIVFVLPKTTEFGGLERHLFSLLRGLNEAPNPSIVSFDQQTISEYMDDDLRARTKLICVPEPKSLRDWYRLVRTQHADVIVFCYNWFKAFPWQAPLAGWLAGVGRRISIQHLIPLPPPPPVEGKSPTDSLRRIIGRRARYMLKVNLTGRLSHKTICVSNAVRDSLVRNYQFPVNKTITIHNGVSTSFFAPSARTRAAVREQFDVSEEDFLLVCAARLTEHKGVDIVIHAVSRVLRQGIPCKCIIVGDGPLKEKLQKEANALGLEGYVFFEGFQADVRPYLQAASAFILTSHIEGLPLSILEAMACGLPSIVTDVGGNAEAVLNKVTGLVVAPGSLDETEDAIAYLATHNSECAQMASAARELARRAFDNEKQLAELKAVILG